MTDIITPRDLDNSIVANFIQELHVLMDKYEGMMLIPTMMGCLDIAKAELLDEMISINSDDESEDDGEDDE